MKKERLSNFELMRIISMLFIVLWHLIVHSTVRTSINGTTELIFNFLISIIIVHVNSFILLSGYFQYKNNMKVEKAIKINNSMWFYTFVITMTLLILNIAEYPIGKVDIIKALIPLDFGNYWFMNNYLILYLISPILNKFIDSLNKNKFKQFIIVIFIFFSGVTYLSNGQVFDVTGGFSLYHFVMLYFIGAYLGKYGIWKNNTKELKRTKALLLFSFFAFVNVMIHYFGYHLLSYNSNSLNYFAGVFANSFYNYNNPLVVCCAVMYLIIFETLDFKSKIVNKISPLVLGVYLLTDNCIHNGNYVKSILYDRILHLNLDFYSLNVLPKLVLYTLIIFAIGILVEYIRQSIFKFIYNRKTSFKIRKKIKNYIKNIGFSIE